MVAVDISLNLDSESKAMLAAVLAYVLIQMAFFPSMYLSIDEHEYAKNAVLLRGLDIGVNDPGNACRAGIYNSHGYVSTQFIGRSVFIMPFTFLGIEGIMLSGLVLHLVNFLLVALILRKLGISRLFALLYLFYPSMVWGARTLFPEMLVLTGMLAGLLFYLGDRKRDWLLSGLFFSLSVLSRYDALFAFLAFLVAAFIADRRKAAFMAAGAAPVGALIFMFNSLFYSGGFATGYGSGGSLLNTLAIGVIDIDNIYYAAILMAFYPLLLVSPYASRKFPLKTEFMLLTIVYFVLNSAFTSFGAFSFSVETSLTARLRYLIPLIGLLIIPYSVLLSQLMESSRIRLTRPAIAVAIILMLFGAGLLSFKHSGLISTRSSVFSAVYSITPDGSTIIGSADDCIFFLPGIFPERKYYSVDLAQDLAGNPEKLSLEGIKTGQAYVMELYYGHQSGRESTRQQVVDAERKRMADFVSENSGSLSAVYESSSPNTLRIYKWK
ncbi:MAG: hypothetical protein HY544_01805 [Candidatus Diapherotrites archaeon]|uniref:Uncharacterized protein n=1 Tax=Candidatus Iainarchaeum sp. TaxID=3101447 RepID=A0A8T3YK97_9ARCH|nr:hypothetical protein [Candidatus Diapherotrites archaeon]